MGQSRIEIRGAVEQLWRVFAPGEKKSIKEVLIDGPRGTGKSRGVSEFLYWLCDTHKGVRVLVVRKTRASLTESFIPMWEGQVVGKGHACLSGPSRIHRHSYEFPNGSSLVLGSLEEPERLYSTDWDVVVFQQGEEVGEKQWQDILPCLRHWAVPVQMAIADCNPGPKGHWLMRRVETGRMLRFRSRHTDNPLLWDAENGRWQEEGEAYMGILKALKGVAYQRQYLGEWTTAEGAVWESFDPISHVIPCPMKKDLNPPEKDWEALGIQGWIGSIDWGYTKPGSFQVWGVSGGAEKKAGGVGDERRMVLAREYYSTQKTLEWWADRVMQSYREHPFDVIVADPSRNDNIQLMNDMLVRKGFRALVRPADNKRRSTNGDLAGLDLVRWGFYPDAEGLPRIRLLADALQERDETLVSASKPYSTETEIPLFVFSENRQGGMNEETDPGCEDHGCDALRYAAMWVWKRQVKTQVTVERDHGPWSYGGMFGTPRGLLLARLRREHDAQSWSEDA